MTKIFRSSFYRSKQPEEEEEESAAAEEYDYVDLEDGQGGTGKHAGGGGGGVDSDGPHTADVVRNIVTGIIFIIAGCVYLAYPCGVQSSTGGLYLALGASVLARLAPPAGRFRLFLRVICSLAVAYFIVKVIVSSFV